jgi:hypothetical protein
MVQKTFIASRSLQPGTKSTVIFAATARASPMHATTLIQTTTPIQTTESARQGRIEISEFRKNC